MSQHMLDGEGSCCKGV